MPKLSDVYVNRPLSDLSVAWAQDQSGYIADIVFPPISSEHASGSYYEFPRAAWLRDEAKKRAPCTESVGGDYDLITRDYSTCNFAYHKDICDDVVDNADAALNLEREAAMFVAMKMLLRKDSEWAQAYFQTGVWSSDVDVSAGTRWDQPGATPIADLRAAICDQGLLTGFEPNTLVLARKTYNALLDSADFLNRVQFGQVNNPSMVSTDLMAAVLGIDRVVVAHAIRNVAAESKPDTESNEHILAEGALLTYSAPNPGLMTPSAGYTFNWTGRRGAGQNGMRTLRFEMPHLRAMRIEGEVAFEHKLVSADMGTYFFNTLTP